MAEFGVNWKNREQALFMMGMAKSLGINLIKFQLFQKEDVQEEIKSMVINEELAKELFEVGKSYGQDVFFSCMYPEAVDICEKIGVKYYKVRYFDRKNLPLYRKLKKTDKLIFVSCQDPHDTIFYSMVKYQKRVNFLYCVPKYPAQFRDYPLITPSGFSGFSDHTDDIQILEHYLEYPYPDWFEIHVKLDNNCVESKWSKSFEELKEVLENGK